MAKKKKLLEYNIQPEYTPTNNGSIHSSNIQPMSVTEYERILVHGNRVDWYGVLTPEELCTDLVKYKANMVDDQINRLIAEGLDSTKDYIESLRNNVINLPYTQGGSDTYQIKRRQIESVHNIIPDTIKPRELTDIEKELKQSKKELRKQRKKDKQ